MIEHTLDKLLGIFPSNTINSIFEMTKPKSIEKQHKLESLTEINYDKDNKLDHQQQNCNQSEDQRVVRTSKPLKCPNAKPNYLKETSANKDNERQLEQFYDESTWNMYYLITSARQKEIGTRSKRRNYTQNQTFNEETGKYFSIQSHDFTLSNFMTPKLVACRDHSDNGDEDEVYEEDEMPFLFDDF